jgi:hypothetical protein
MKRNSASDQMSVCDYEEMWKRTKIKQNNTKREQSANAKILCQNLQRRIKI